MENYFDEQEIIDIELLNTFNDRKHLFNKLIPNKRFSRIDISGKDRTGADIKIELKQRFCTINAFSDIYIEIDKAKALQAVDCKAAYINFFQTADVVAIWDMHKIDLSKTKIQYNVKVWNKGKKEYKIVDRYLLPLTKATIYIWNDDKKKYYVRHAIH